MANKARGEIAVEFEGKRVKLILSFNAMCDLEGSMGRRFPDILEELNDPSRLEFDTVRHVFWGMMLENYPDTTKRDAGNLVQGLRGRTDQIMAQAIEAAFPEANAGGGEPEK